MTMGWGPVQLPRQVGDVLEPALGANPTREAVVGSDSRLSYGQLDRTADGAATALWDLGVRRGDVVGASLPNTTEIAVVFHAVMRVGAIFLGVNRSLAPPEKAFILDDAGAAAVITSPTDIEALSAVTKIPAVATNTTGGLCWEDTATDGGYRRAVCDLDDAAGIAYTSGTTGRPKGVVHSHRNLLLPGAAVVMERRYGADLRKGDCTALTILNLQVTSTLLTAQAGGTQVIMDRTDPVGIASWIREEQITSWFGVPTMLHGLALAPDVAVEDLASLEDVWTGGAHTPLSVRQAFEARFGKRVHSTYGMTEVPTIVTIEPLGTAPIPGSSGQPLPHLVVEIRGDDGQVLPVGHTGEITVRAQREGPWAGLYRPMLGYHGHADATMQTVREAVLYTGDVGEVDEAGHLFVHGRRRALILRGGANIYPAEVERVVAEVPGVLGVAVVGVADNRLGQRVAAAVELAPGAAVTAGDLDARCRANLARYKVPEQWRFVELPRNAMGKIARAELEHLFE